MIHEIVKELASEVAARKCPVRVLERETTTTTTWGRERIVIDEPGPDQFLASRGVHVNPPHRRAWIMGCTAMIFAQATRAGALEWEHRRRAREIAETVIAGLYAIARKRRNALDLRSGQFVTIPDLEQSERFAGVLYVVSFGFERPVRDQDFNGEVAPEATLGDVAIRNTTNVYGPNGVGSGETGCGG